jgi:hypothetical protein
MLNKYKIRKAMYNEISPNFNNYQSFKNYHFFKKNDDNLIILVT